MYNLLIFFIFEMIKFIFYLDVFFYKIVLIIFKIYGDEIKVVLFYKCLIKGYMIGGKYSYFY